METPARCAMPGLRAAQARYAVPRSRASPAAHCPVGAAWVVELWIATRAGPAAAVPVKMARSNRGPLYELRKVVTKESDREGFELDCDIPKGAVDPTHRNIQQEGWRRAVGNCDIDKVREKLLVE